MMLYVNALVLVSVYEHLDTGIDQECTEDQQQPVELLDKRTCREDENEAQHDCPENAIE